MNGTVETVLGPIVSSDLGRVLTHEHLALDFEKFYVPTPKIFHNLINGRIDLSNVGTIKQYPYGCKYNIRFNDADSANAVSHDVGFYKKCGGGTIVENTSYGIERDIVLMRRISQETGVHVVAGTGHYVAMTQNEAIVKSTEEQMYDLMMRELTLGCDEMKSVKAGFIGEVGSTWPIEDFEKKAIRATARVQEQLDCPVSFHPGRNAAAPFEILRLFTEAGGKADRAIMSHLDRTLINDDDLLEFAKLGAYCQYDLFGIECSLYQLHVGTDMPSDAQRLDKMRLIKNDGRLDRLLMSHDIHTKHRLMNFGGHGYAHILNNVVPKMLVKGFTKEDVDAITITNPCNWLSRVKASL